jgi:hypothetical protein
LAAPNCSLFIWEAKSNSNEQTILLWLIMHPTPQWILGSRQQTDVRPCLMLMNSVHSLRLLISYSLNKPLLNPKCVPDTKCKWSRCGWCPHGTLCAEHVLWAKYLGQTRGDDSCPAEVSIPLGSLYWAPQRRKNSSFSGLVWLDQGKQWSCSQELGLWPQVLCPAWLQNVGKHCWKYFLQGTLACTSAVYSEPSV